MTITVSTGGMKKVIDAENPYEAVKKFFLELNPTQAVGLVSCCESDELDDTYYVSNQRVLEELGMWEPKS